MINNLENLRKWNHLLLRFSKNEIFATDSTPRSSWNPVWLTALIALFCAAAAGAFEGVCAVFHGCFRWIRTTGFVSFITNLLQAAQTAASCSSVLFECPVPAVLSIFWWLVQIPPMVDGIAVEYFPENCGGTGIGKLTDEQKIEIRFIIRRYRDNRKKKAKFGKFR